MKLLNFFSIFFVFTFLYTNLSYSFVWEVGPTKTYQSPNALYLADVNANITISDGDSVRIDFANYSGNATLANWSQNNLLLQGVGGQPKLSAAGQNIQGKGIWILSGDNIIVDNIAFYDATVPDENGAGIRLEGNGVIIRNCYFQDNENGILGGGSGDVLIEYSEFNSNGFGDGFTHNMYIGHVDKFTIQYSYTHHTNVGHNIKSRASNNYILYNRIMDEETGNSSRLVDLPNGGYAMVMGNVMMQGPNALNNNCIGYGLEGLSNPAPHEFNLINNTIINKRVASCNYVQLQSGLDIANITNNIFAGDGNELVGTATNYENNYYTDDISSLNFVDELNYNYQLLQTSPAVDSGIVQVMPLVANKEYILDLNYQSRPSYGSSIDVGAYEFFIDEASVSDNVLNLVSVYPNPTNSILHFNSNLKINKITVIDVQGKRSVAKFTSGVIDVSNLPTGLYFLEFETEDGLIVNKIIVE